MATSKKVSKLQEIVVEKQVVVYQIELSELERDTLEDFLGDFNECDVVAKGFTKKQDDILNDIYQAL